MNERRPRIKAKTRKTAASYHRISSPLIVLRFSCWHLSLASLVINEMNSDTHSWMLSFASFAILALFGSVFFIIRAIFAIGRNLRHIKYEGWSCTGHRSRPIPVLLADLNFSVPDAPFLAVFVKHLHLGARTQVSRNTIVQVGSMTSALDQRYL